MLNALESSNVEQLILDALKDSYWEIRLQALQNLDKLSEEHVKKAMSTIRDIASTDSNSNNRILALDYLTKNLSESEITDMIIKTIQSDSSYKVIRYALVVISDLDAVKAKELVKEMEADPSSSMKVIIGEYYEYFGTEENLTFFKNLFDKNQLIGQDIIYGTKSLAAYLVAQRPEVQMQLIPYFRSIYYKGGVYGQRYLSYYAGFVIETIESQLLETKALLDANKKNNNENMTSELKLIQIQQETILKQLKLLLEDIASEKN